jgi:hypothetical protein
VVIRKGTEVSHSIYGGLWKVISSKNPQTIFSDCRRYSLKNTKTDKVITDVRDKDVITKDNLLFEQFVLI